MAKKIHSTKSGRKKATHPPTIHKHLKRHFPTFYEQPFFGAGILALAILALILFTASH